MKLLLRIAYDGSRYGGYQVQKNAPSIQEKLNEATEKLFGFPCDIVGCSRTDSGVHAEDFCLTVAKKGESGIVTSVSPEAVPRAIRSFLPPDITVKSAACVPDSFHARYDVRYKEYRYLICDRAVLYPHEAGHVMAYKRKITDEAVRRMNEACRYFVGKHDFSAMMAQGSDVSTTVRTVISAYVKREGDLVVFRVAADGFLYNMVRILTGTLLAVAEGKIPPEEIPALLASGDRNRAGMTVPAEGLTLLRVVY